MRTEIIQVREVPAEDAEALRARAASRSSVEADGENIRSFIDDDRQ